MSFGLSRLRGRAGRLTLQAVAGGSGAVLLAAVAFAVPAAAAVRSPGASPAVTGQVIGHRDAAKTAAATLKITSVLCEGGDFSGSCEVEWSGGTPPYTVTWTPEGNDFFGTSTDTDSAARTSTITGSCVAGGELEAIAVVTDANGQTARGGSGAECDS
jgi:hypothetical protein